MTSDVPLQPWQWPEATWRKIVSHVRAGRSLAPKCWKGMHAQCRRPILRCGSRNCGTPQWWRILREAEPRPSTAGAGSPRILRILERHGVKATFFMPAVAAMINPSEPRAVVDAGHEIAFTAGFMNSTPSSATSERDLAFRAQDTLEKLSGQRPVGMRTASWDYSPWTLKIVREMGLSLIHH